MSRSTVVGRHRGREILQVTLQSGAHEVTILNYGCVIQDWRLQCADEVRPIVLGFDSFEPYLEHSPSFGIVAGRLANRTKHGKFNLYGVDYQLDCNERGNHLHGGTVGLGVCVWDMDTDTAGNSILLKMKSLDGDQGYPGQLDLTVEYRLDENGLCCVMQAVPDRDTPVNLAQHNYYNLDSAVGDINPTIRNHKLQVNARHYLPVDDQLLPTGVLAPVAGTRFDFTKPRKIIDNDPEFSGIDHNLVLDTGYDTSQSAEHARQPVLNACLQSSNRDVQLQIFSDQPGLQLYTGSKLAVAVKGHQGQQYNAFAGLCLEAQHFPDSVNHPEWPSTICSPDQPYHQHLEMRASFVEGSESLGSDSEGI